MTQKLKEKTIIPKDYLEIKTVKLLELLPVL